MKIAEAIGIIETRIMKDDFNDNILSVDFLTCATWISDKNNVI